MTSEHRSEDGSTAGPEPAPAQVSMARSVRAVIFDWGGTLTPWHDVDLTAHWYAYASVFDPKRAGRLAAELFAAEIDRWQEQHRTRGALGAGRLEQVLTDCGVDVTSGRHYVALAAYLEFWEPHTQADPDAGPLLRALRERGLKVGVLSNTLWPRTHHERVFARDGLLELIDGAVYSSELPVGKPHADAFRAAMLAIGETDPARVVFVGDRPWDDVHGAKLAGMRTILVPHSDIPEDQRGPVEGDPDAVVHRLIEVLDHVDRWNAQAGSLPPAGT